MESVTMKRLKSFLFVLIAFTLLAWGLHAAMNYGCDSETIAKSSLAAADVEIIYTNCDTLAKTESIDVYLTKPGGNAWPAMLGWVHRRTLVFRYDPAATGGPDGEKPQVTEDSAGIHVAISQVSSVQVKEGAWGGKSIGYSIHKIDYP
jgi:hypothetical protein